MTASALSTERAPRLPDIISRITRSTRLSPSIADGRQGPVDGAERGQPGVATMDRSPSKNAGMVEQTSDETRAPAQRGGAVTGLRRSAIRSSWRLSRVQTHPRDSAAPRCLTRAYASDRSGSRRFGVFSHSFPQKMGYGKTHDDQASYHLARSRSAPGFQACRAGRSMPYSNALPTTCWKPCMTRRASALPPFRSA